MKKFFLPFFVFLLFFLACVEKKPSQPVGENASNITFQTYVPEYAGNVSDENFSEEAAHDKDFQMCERTGEENRSKDDCLFHHATIGPCSNLYGTEKAKCLAFYYNDSSYCEDENCLFEYAIEFKDIAVCNSIPPTSRPDLSAACKSYILNEDHCKDVQANNRDFCYYFITTSKNQLHLCSKIYSNYYRSECAVYKAVHEKNPSACALLEYTAAYYNCLRRYATETSDVTGCLMIHYRAPSHNGCLYELAEKYRNPSYCVNITDSNMRVNCYSMTMGVENITYSLSDCMKINEEVWKEKCILRLAQFTNDPSLCKYLRYLRCTTAVSG